MSIKFLKNKFSLEDASGITKDNRYLNGQQITHIIQKVYKSFESDRKR